MPLAIRCDCGRQLRVAEQHAGKRVKCPGCGGTVDVPDPEATTRTAAPPRIRFECPCGKAMQAKAEYAGQKTRCPDCGKAVTIPGGGAAGREEKSRIRAGKPAPRRAAPPPDDDWDEEEERPARRKRKPEKTGSKLALFLVLGAVLFLILAGGAAGAVWWFMRDTPAAPGGGGGGPIAAVEQDPRDVDLVAADAKVLGGVRAADLWQNAAIQGLYAKARPAGGGPDPLVEMQNRFGLTPEQVSRVLVVVIDPDTELSYLVVTTTVDYDRQKLLAQMTAAAPRQHAGKAYHVSQTAFGKPPALYFAGKKVLVWGPEPAVQRCLTAHSEKRTDAALVADLEGLLKDHQSAFIFKSGLPPAAKQQVAQGLPREAQGAQVLMEFTRATASARVDNALTIRLSATYPDEAKARQSKTQIDGFVGLARLSLFALEGELKKAGLPEAEAKQVVAQASAILDSIQVNQQGAEVTATVSADLQALMQTVEKLIQTMPGPGRVPAGPPGGFRGSRGSNPSRPGPPGRR